MTKALNKPGFCMTRENQYRKEMMKTVAFRGLPLASLRLAS